MKNKISNFILASIVILIIYLISCYIYNFYYSNTLKFILNQPNANYKQCLQLHPMQPKKVVRILVISGGGVNGLIPLAFLDYIEKKTKRPTHELFDLFVATSAGTIIESSLTMPDDQGHYFSADDIFNKFLNDASSFLATSFWRSFFTLDGLLGPKLDTGRIYNGFRDKPFSANAFYKLPKDIVFTNTELDTLTLTLLKNWDCANSRVYSPISQILTSTSALPLVFAPVDFIDSQGKKRTFADGALYSNRPFLEALSVAKERNPDVEKIILVLLTTGTQPRVPLDWKAPSFNHWGLIKWFQAIIRIMFTAQQYEAHEGIKDLITLVPDSKLKYYHLKAKWQNDPLDVSEKNLENLSKAARQAILDNQEKLDELIKQINI